MTESSRKAINHGPNNPHIQLRLLTLTKAIWDELDPNISCTQLKLITLEQIMNSLLETRDDPSSQSIFFFVRRSLRQFRLTSFYSESDILIEAFLRTYLSIQQGKHIDNLPGWIRSVSFNIIREHSRRTIQARKFSKELSYEQVTHLSSDKCAHDIDDQSICRLIAALETLSDRDRHILTLRVVKGLSWRSVQEHCAEAGSKKVSEAALRKQGTRALERLRQAFYASAPKETTTEEVNNESAAL